MKIAELEQASGTSRSTIHLYRNLGLLPAPRRLGPKLHLFDATHVERLKEIKQLRAQGLSLSQIRARLSGSEAQAAPDLDRRSVILQVASRRFVESGYDGVRLVDIARELHMSKAGLYRYFATKEDLFVECIDQIRLVVVSAAERQELTQITDFKSRARIRTVAVLKNFKAYRAMTQLLSNVAHGPQRTLADKARDALHRMITGVTADLDAAIAAGEYRQADTELDAYLLWGALMAAGDRMLLDDRYSIDHAADAYLDLVTLGTLPRKSASQSRDAQPPVALEITDASGTRIRLPLASLETLRIAAPK
jgi:AcrR family transcriptional regulator/predicted DNA-binding transcriptional regulator AlpA